MVPVHKGYGTQYGAGGSGYGFMVHIDLALRQYRSPVQITVVGSQLQGYRNCSSRSHSHEMKGGYYIWYLYQC